MRGDKFELEAPVVQSFSSPVKIWKVDRRTGDGGLESTGDGERDSGGAGCESESDSQSESSSSESESSDSLEVLSSSSPSARGLIPTSKPSPRPCFSIFNPSIPNINRAFAVPTFVPRTIAMYDRPDKGFSNTPLTPSIPGELCAAPSAVEREVNVVCRWDESVSIAVSSSSHFFEAFASSSTRFLEDFASACVPNVLLLLNRGATMLGGDEFATRVDKRTNLQRNLALLIQKMAEQRFREACSHSTRYGVHV